MKMSIKRPAILRCLGSAPADGSSIVTAKIIATTIVASAYRLVEDVFENDKKSFLNATLQTLKELTEIVEYSDSIKEEYGLLVLRS